MTQPTPPSGQNPWAPPPEGSPPEGFQVPPAPPAPEQFGPPEGPPPGYQGGHPGGFQGGYPGGYGYPSPPLHDAPRNGMAITSLVLGLVGAILGMLIFLFWMTWLPSLLAVIFGFVALGQVKKGTATHKGMAIAGMILGMVGILLAIGTGVFAVTSIKDSVREGDRVLQVEASESRKADDARSREASEEAAAEKARHLRFGETYTYPNGLKVTVSKPVPYAFDDYTVSVDTKGKKALQVVVTVVNGSSAPVDFRTSLPQATDAEGNDAELVIDGSSRQEIISGKVGPGKRKVGKTAHAMPAGASGSLEVIFTPDLALFEDVYWSGPTE